MNIESFTQRESMLELQKNLILAEEERLLGKTGHTVEEISSLMKKAVQEVVRAK